MTRASLPENSFWCDPTVTRSAVTLSAVEIERTAFAPPEKRDRVIHGGLVGRNDDVLFSTNKKFFAETFGKSMKRYAQMTPI
jgi:hypothetical protein